MILQTMPEQGLCLPTSFAMVLDLPVKDLLKQLSNWHQTVFPGLPEPLCWRGVHIQECIRIAQDMGYAVTPREMYPQVAPPRPNDAEGKPYEPYPIAFGDNARLFADVILLSQGVITGVRAAPFKGVIGHAVAYDHGYIYDPNGYEYAYEEAACEEHNFFTQCAWRMDRIAEAHA
jgi:hypothetical protein